MAELEMVMWGLFNAPNAARDPGHAIRFYAVECVARDVASVRPHTVVRKCRVSYEIERSPAPGTGQGEIG
jgi:hypothetical protein